MRLSPEQQQEIDQFYWETDISARELKEYYELSKPVYLFVSPLPTGVQCPNCGSELVYKSRAGRTSDEKVCINCGHTDRSIYTCHCEFCQTLKSEERKRHEEELRQLALKAFEERLEETSSEEYVMWALSKLSRREKIFLKAFIEVVEGSQHPTWEEICDRAKAVSHKSYVNKLTQIGLLHSHPDGGIMRNPTIKLDMIEIKQVRRISKSLRFEVLQRDAHVCQYCGRRPPEVELEIDHLVPVAEGGTDDFNNLVTSCRDCNRGKSAKLIERFTGGYSKDEWRQVIRRKKMEAIQARREQLQDIMQYWAECRGMKSVSSYDAKGIYSLIERYEPEWIKAAIEIASRYRPSNYVKYVGGILRNWAKDGLPDYLQDPDTKLKERKATQKQIDYIQSLLEDLGLELGESYHKDSFDDLNMLDARNLIEALKKPVLDQSNGA